MTVRRTIACISTSCSYLVLLEIVNASFATIDSWQRMDEVRRQTERLVLLAPIEPARGGNGLAMRTELFRRAASAKFAVRVIVVPAAGRMPRGAPISADVVRVATDPVRARVGARRLVGDAAWRQRLAAVGDLPLPARVASPGLADAVMDEIGMDRCSGVHVMRSYLAPLGVALAERLQTRWMTLDLDEDDACLAAALGHSREAAAYSRMLTIFAPLFDALSAASAAEAEGLGKRHDVVVEQVPNAVDVRTLPTSRRPSCGGASPTILFVGNLTYAPNREAATLLATEILPELKARLGPGVRVKLVGPCDRELGRLAAPGVEITGFVADLRPIYAAADIVVVPLRSGAGTRLKLLDAFAQGIPVVASSIAAAGLEVTGGRHLILAEGPVETAAAVERLLLNPELAQVFALDQRGHGDSERLPSDVSRGAYVQDAAETIRHLGLGPVTLVGQSMGANTAMLTAAQHPDLVNRLVVIEGSPDGPDPPDPQPAVADEIRDSLSRWPVPFADDEAARSFFCSKGLEPFTCAWPTSDRAATGSSGAASSAPPSSSLADKASFRQDTVS